jgi:hypothetical protein
MHASTTTAASREATLFREIGELAKERAERLHTGHAAPEDDVPT